MAIFALLGVLALGGLSYTLDSARRGEAGLDELTRLQAAVAYLGRDLQQAAPRPVRDLLGGGLPAFLAPGDDSLEFTRQGWRNPLGAPRSTLQRVGWRVEQGVLVRYHWNVLDRGHGAAPVRAVLLDGVQRLQVRLLDGERRWRVVWPQPSGNDAATLVALPLAVEATLELERWGTIRRLWALADTSPGQGDG